MKRERYAPDFIDETTGWTPGDVCPRWVSLVAWLLGVTIRKLWVYVCAPFGLIGVALGAIFAFTV